MDRHRRAGWGWGEGDDPVFLNQPPLPFRARYGPPIVIVLIVLLCFSPVLHNDFVNWDDDINFLDNPNYRGLSPAHLAWMFTTFQTGPYQPLSWLSHGLVYTVWGMSPVGYHLVNLLLHASNAVLLYSLIVGLLRHARAGATPTADMSMALAATTGALFFAVHPLRVEAVAWATERREVLSACFLLLTLLAYLRMVDAAGLPPYTRRKWLGVSLACYALSLLSKATGMSLPVILTILDVYPLRRLAAGTVDASGNQRKVLIEKLPYAALAGAAAITALAGQRHAAATLTLASHGVVERVMQCAYGLIFYVWKTLVPSGLSPLYLLPRPLQPTGLRFVVPAALCLGITAAFVYQRRSWPWALAAWTSYVVTVLPVLGLVQSGPQIVADRYSYLACLPWAVLVAVAVGWIERSRERRWLGRLVRPITLAVVTTGLGVLGVLTYAQTRLWKDSVTLWTHTLAVEPDNYVAYAARGKARLLKADVDGAVGDFDNALRLDPVYVEALVSRGNARQQKGALDAAIADFTAALRTRPGDARTLVNRGNARQMRGDLDGALADYSASLRIDPQLAAAYYRRANVYRAKGDLAAALADYNQSLRLDPTAAYAYNNRAIAREAQGDLAGAVADYSAALRLMPESGPFQRNVARARQLAGASGNQRVTSDQ